MPRLLQDALPPPTGDAPEMVNWSARGVSKPVASGQPEIRLLLQAHTTVQMACQRCLQPLAVPLDVSSSLRFVHGEQQAEALDEHSEEDVLALTSTLDLQRLVEDELILALPLVPRHEPCPQPLPMAAGDEEIATSQASGRAFAALAALRGGTADGGEQEPQ